MESPHHWEIRTIEMGINEALDGHQLADQQVLHQQLVAEEETGGHQYSQQLRVQQLHHGCTGTSDVLPMGTSWGCHDIIGHRVGIYWRVHGPYCLNTLTTHINDFGTLLSAKCAVVTRQEGAKESCRDLQEKGKGRKLP